MRRPSTRISSILLPPDFRANHSMRSPMSFFVFSRLCSVWRCSVFLRLQKLLLRSSLTPRPSKRYRPKIAKPRLMKSSPNLKKKLSAREAENEAAENDLKKADQSISEANRRLRTLKTERSTVEQRLSELRQDGRSVERDLREARSRYEQIMRAQYVHAQRHSCSRSLRAATRMNSPARQRSYATCRLLSKKRQRP